jgi:hypothetical protein
VDPHAVVSQVRRTIAERYVLPERRPALDAVLAEGQNSGRYNVREPAVLAERINSDLARVGRDGHLNFSYNPERFAMLTARTGDDRPDFSVIEQDVRRRNHGVRALRLLPGNVRYLELSDWMFIGEESETALNAAMQFLSGGDAVIIDIRRNGGGTGRAVQQVISHFLEAGRPLMTFYRGNEAIQMPPSLTGLSGMVGKPLYVLTSGGSASASEEFVGHVLGYRLGEVVGGNTAGAAFSNGLYPVAGGFVLSVSEQRPVLAATGGDWERTGFAPTIPAPVESALETAHIHALRRLAAAGTPRAGELEALAAGLEAVARPGTPGAPLAAYAGTYGDRQIILEGGQLWYREGTRARRRLVPVGGHAFVLADDPVQRLVFQRAGGRIPAFDLGLANGPVVGRYERSR